MSNKENNPVKNAIKACYHEEIIQLVNNNINLIKQAA